MSVLTVAQVKTRLNKTLSVDDAELQEMLDAAEAEYAEWVGPIGVKTLRFDGGRTTLLLPLFSTVTSVAYEDGTEVDVDDVYVDEDGVLRWAFGSPGVFTPGTRNVLVTLTASLPAQHREAILADVAGYFAATQRGGGSVAPRFPGEGYAEPYEGTVGPVTLFPRIRALAASYPSIA